MNNEEARAILAEAVQRFSQRDFASLLPLVECGHVERTEVRGASGATYQVEIQFIWDDIPGETIRIIGAIDDLGWRAFIPLTESDLVRAP